MGSEINLDLLVLGEHVGAFLQRIAHALQFGSHIDEWRNDVAQRERTSPRSPSPSDSHSALSA